MAIRFQHKFGGKTIAPGILNWSLDESQGAIMFVSISAIEVGNEGQFPLSNIKGKEGGV
jgi:hypothetical protein